jgi:acyl carrier protein
MQAGEARQAIVEALDKVSGALGIAEFAPALNDPQRDITFASVGLDSLTGLEFCLEIEDRTGLELDLGHLLTHHSVNRLAAFIAGTLASR